MDPISLIPGASIISSLIGLFQGNDSGKYIQKAVDELIKVKIPDPAQQKLALERFHSAGELSPELEHAIKEDPSAFQQVVQNTKYSQAQDRALGQLQSLGEQGGFSLSDKAGLQQELLENANKDKANREAITDEMARRGQGGSGMSLQAQLQGQQASGDRDAMARLSALGSAHDRALQAIQGAGTLAGQMGQQDWQRKSDVATAQDRINQFNTQNAQAVQERNVGARNQAAAANLNNAQTVMNQNTQLSNQEQQYNKELLQKQYENQLQKSKAVADAYTQQAQQANQNSANNKQAWGAVGSSLGQMGSTIQNQNNWNDFLDAYKNKKTNGVQ